MKEQIGGHQRPPKGMEELCIDPAKRQSMIEPTMFCRSPCPHCGGVANHIKSSKFYPGAVGRLLWRLYECRECKYRFSEC